MSEQTYGQKAVGLSFNPSGDPDVNRIKQLYADIIDLMNDLRTNTAASGEVGKIGEKVRLCSIAVTQAQDAQMWAVKAITWED